MEVTFIRTHFAKRGDSTYKAEGYGTLHLSKSVKGHPETIGVSGLAEPAPAEAKAKAPRETKEERKARLDAMTPEQRAQAKKDAAAKSLENARKRAEKLGVAAA